MKKSILVLCLLTMFTLTKASTPQDFHNMAEGMSQSLIKHFWSPSFPGYEQRYYFNYGSDLSDMGTSNYWPEAHAMDVMVDAYLRSRDKTYLDIFPLWWKGMPAHHHSANLKDPWWAEFVDDMEWMILAQIRMFEATGNRAYIEKARQMYDDWVWPTWGPDNESPWYGGITWKTDIEKSKNACSNGPAAIIAAKLYMNYKKAGFKTGKKRKEYLKEAKMIFQWLKTNLYDEASGAVYDNMNKKGNITKWVFTYNNGTFIGAANLLQLITGKRQYLADAQLAADYVIKKMSDNDGVLNDAPRGDGGLFHGIFFRYFAQLINNPHLNDISRRQYKEYIMKSAQVMAQQGVNPRTMLYGGRWHQAPEDNEKICLTAQLTGCMLMEAACTLK